MKSKYPFINKAGSFISREDFKQVCLRMLATLVLLELTSDPRFKIYHKAYEDEFEIDMEIDKVSNDRVRFISEFMYFDITRSEMFGLKKKLKTNFKKLKEGK